MHEFSIQLNDRNYIFAYDLTAIRGLRGNVEVIKTGTWYSNPAYTPDFFMYMRARGYKDENKGKDFKASNPEVSI